ncbi:MAG: protein tyrosine phosphatase family protein [Gemmatimonadaceae bacterium]
MHDTPDPASLARALPYGAYLLDGVATAGQPNEAQFDQIGAAGYRAVVDLRPASEPRGCDERAAIERAGMRYVELPVTAATLTDAHFDRMRELLRDPSNRPVLVHCASANRVGALMLPYLVLDEGQPMPDAFRMAQSIGMRSAELAQMAADYVRRHADG